MASGIARASSRRAKAQVKGSKNNTTDKWVGKKHKVEPGDVVTFKSPNNHMMGGIGTVIGYVTKNEVLIKTFGGMDDDYPPMYISVRNQAPNHSYAGDDFEAAYQHYITRVPYRVSPKPPKKRKPVKFYEVTPKVLPAVLSGEHEVPDGHKVVLVPDQEGAPDAGA